MQGNTGGTTSLDQVRSWLNNCLANHQNCRDYCGILKAEHAPSNPFRPTRLVKIGLNNIHLHNTEEITYRYAALSHRWPDKSANVLQLTTANQADFETNIPQSINHGFSQVFADAVKVCRHIGIAYLWIDTLCIIQSGDEGKDWRNEATRMGNVYKHAEITIAAQSADDPHKSLRSGMFRTRDADTMLGRMVENATFDRKVKDWGLPPVPFSSLRVDRMLKTWKTPKPGRYFLVSARDWTDDITKTPLSLRGWVEQERVLSTRILHFTSKQVFFDCYEAMSSEVWPGGHPSFHKRRTLKQWTILQDLALCKAGKLDVKDLQPEKEQLIKYPLYVWFRPRIQLC